jgi:predicted 2-oxoglutarate/Fe(II)-dependent dioxygenase YbiX
MNNNELDALFTGLTGTADNKQEVSTPKVQTTTKVKKSSAGRYRLRQKMLEQNRNQERFCTIIDSDVLKKIRIIATREGHQIKDVVEAALIKAIDGYERKHGVIEDNTKRKAIDLF